MDIVGDGVAVGIGGAEAELGVAGELVAGLGGVDDVLDNGGIGEAEGGEPEANGDAGNGTQLNAHLAEDGVDNAVEERGKEENGQGVKVLHKVVGHAVTLHLLGLGDKVGGELAVADPEDGVEDEDLAGAEGTLELVDKVVVPADEGLVVGGAPRVPGGIGAAPDNHHAEGLEGVGDDGALGRSDNVRLAAGDEDNDANVEHAEAHEEGGPEALVLFHKGRGHEGEGTEVDTPIEDHVDSLVGDGRVDDDALARFFRLDGHATALVLVGNEGGNVGLDTTGAEANNDDGDNVASKTGGVAGGGERGGPENQEADPVDAEEDDNGLVLAEILIRDDGTENGGDVAEPLEEEVETGGGLVAHAETLGAILAVLVVADVVLEETLGTIVGEALGQLDNGNEEGRGREVLANTAQGATLVVAGLLAVGGGARLKVTLLDGADLGIGFLNIATSNVGMLVGNALRELFVEPGSLVLVGEEIMHLQ